MSSDKARLRRVRTIERVRAAEQRKAAVAAFDAMAVRHKLEKLSERTRSLAQLYEIRDGAQDGAALRGASLLGSHLRELGRVAEMQAEEARQTADGKMNELASAERRRQRAEDESRDVHRQVRDRAASADLPISGQSAAAKRKFGTHLE